MRCLDIKLNGMESVREFVNIANQYPYYIALRQGRAVVDAKSLLGICSLDQTLPVTVDAFSDHTHDLFEALSKYAC